MKTTQSILSDFIKRNNIHSILDEKGGSTKWYKFLEVRMALNMNLDNLINGYLVSDIKVENNKITIKYDVDLEKNYYKIKSIYLNNNKLMISTINHDSNGISSGQNVILNNVKEFNVYIKEALIYFEIITDSGESRIRCI